MIGDPICPDCGMPLSRHELYADGRCPVVRMPPLGELAAAATELPDEVCPRCGHNADQHDEAGCYVCGCPGP